MRGFLKVFLLCAAALSMLLSGCKPKEETAEERTAREAREAREALEKLMRPSVTENMALRFIEEKVHEMAEVPSLGDFRELVGTEWSSMPQPPAENALNIQKRLHEAGELRIDQAIQAVRAEEKTIRAALTKAADAAHPMFKAGDEVELTLARKGADIFVSGRLGDVGADKVMIGRRMIPKVDLSYDDQTKIFPAEHDALVKKIVDKQFASRLGEAMEAAERGEGEALRQALLAAGFVPDIGQNQGARIDARRWISALAFVKRTRQFLQGPAGRAYDGLLDELEAEEDDKE